MTTGIFFFGTPHRGSTVADYGRILAGVANAMTRKPSPELLKALKTKSTALTELTDRFRHQLARYQIVSLYEQRTKGILGGLVRDVEISWPGAKVIHFSMLIDRTDCEQRLSFTMYQWRGPAPGKCGSSKHMQIRWKRR